MSRGIGTGVPAALLTALLCSGALPAPAWADTQTQMTVAAAEALYAEAGKLDAGQGVIQDFARARLLYRQAAEADHAGAQNQLGKYLHAGRGGAENPEEALYWLQRAAAQGAAGHIHDLAVALEARGQYADAAVQYAQAADAGHIDATVSLGLLYQEGLGVTQDPTRARALYETGAANGHPRAQNNLGLLYVRGDGVDQDYEKAAALFAAAAEQGLQPAMTNLGVLYDNGFGVPQSDETAAMWYRRGGGAEQTLGPIYDSRLLPPPQTVAGQEALRIGAAAGDPVAQFLIGWLLLERNAPGDARQAARWFEAAADRGHPPAMANLARLHFLGTGVLQDYVRGQMWATLALAAGMEEAADIALGAGVTLSATQMTQAQQMAQERRAKGHLPEKARE